MIQTQTIDITHVKKILDNCPNFDTIVHYEYPYGDTLSKKLIDWYRELVFSANGNDENQLLLIRALDQSLYLYVRDNKYKRELRNIIKEEELIFKDKDIIKDVINRLITFTNDYQKQEIREVSVAKWL